MNTDEVIMKIYEELQEVKTEVKNTRKAIQKDTKKAITESEKMLLDEIKFNREAVEKLISNVQSNLEELKQYYRITKLENDNTSMLLQMITRLQDDVEELKKKTA